MLTRPRNITYAPKTTLNPSAIISSQKRSRRLSWKRSIISKLLLNFALNFARDVEGYNEESKIESQTLNYMDVFSVEFVVQFF